MTGYLKRVMPLLLLPAVLILPAMQSCTPESCYQETVSQVKAGFYKTGTGENISADSITIHGLEMAASPLVKNTKNLKGVAFPLDPSGESCSLVFIINGINDTVTFHYTSFPHLISKECGYTIYNTLHSYTSTRHLIDTILIRNRNIRMPYEENIRIFF